MSKHTPGPWEYLPETDMTGAITSKKGWVCDFVDAPKEADARLIAAAPELLEALEDVVSFWEQINCTNDMYVKARAAIAKAKE